MTDRDVERPGCAENVLAQQAAFFGLVDCILKDFDGQRVLIADVDETFGGADRIRADEHSFQNGVRIAFQHGAVHIGAWLSFVGVADHVFLVGGSLPGKTPFLSRGKRGATAAPKPRLCNRVDHGIGLHSHQRSEGSPIGAASDRFIQRVGIDRAAVPEDNLLLAAFEIERGPSRHVLEPDGLLRIRSHFSGRDQFLAVEVS